MARLRLPSADRIPGGREFAALSRRVRTLILTGVLFVVLFVLVFTLPVPYVVLSPGPTCNTLGSCYGEKVISITGGKTRATSGHLNLTTVGVSGDHSITAFEALKGWLAGDEVVVPNSSIYPPGESPDQTNKKNSQDFAQSQDSATVAALCELGYPKGFGVIGVTPDGPSKGILQTGDQIVSVDGKATGDADALHTVLMGTQSGKKATVVVTRRTGTAPAQTKSLQVTLGAPPKGETGGRFGVTVSTTCLAPYSVKLGLGDEIGGPSAGLMFALGIIDMIGTQDLTNGKFIAGTGTIDPDGTVGPIGGIQLKMIAAKRKGASVFLAPAGNCGDVRKATPAGLKVVKVANLHDARQDLLKIQNDQPVPSC